MITDVFVGTDRIMITGYNPSSDLTMLKVLYVLTRIKSELGAIPEADFRAWLRSEPGGAEIADKLDAGWRPETGHLLTVDPRNAAQESRIVAFLQTEKAGHKAPDYIAKEGKKCRR